MTPEEIGTAIVHISLSSDDVFKQIVSFLKSSGLEPDNAVPVMLNIAVLELRSRGFSADDAANGLAHAVRLIYDRVLRGEQLQEMAKRNGLQ